MRSAHGVRRVLCVALFCLSACFSFSAAPAFAQQTGTLSGVVRDAQGGVLPGVTVNVASPALIGGARTAVTGETGAYQLPTLPPGTYDVTYELTGFTSLKREGILVRV